MQDCACILAQVIILDGLGFNGGVFGVQDLGICLELSREVLRVGYESIIQAALRCCICLDQVRYTRKV